MPWISHPPGDSVAAPLDAEIARLAERQHGVVKTDQLIVAGLTRNGICQRAKRGLLHRRHQGVYAVGHRALSREGEMLAAVLARAPVPF